MILNENWYPYMVEASFIPQCPYGVPIMLARRGWMNPVIVSRREDINSETNVYGLFWAYTGIARVLLGVQ